MSSSKKASKRSHNGTLSSISKPSIVPNLDCNESISSVQTHILNKSKQKSLLPDLSNDNKSMIHYIKCSASPQVPNDIPYPAVTSSPTSSPSEPKSYDADGPSSVVHGVGFPSLSPSYSTVKSLSPTIAKTSMPSSWSEAKSKAKYDSPSFESGPVSKSKSETYISCGLPSPSKGSYLNEYTLNYSYYVETVTNDSSYLSSLEESMLKAVAGAVLVCSDNKNSSRVLKRRQVKSYGLTHSVDKHKLRLGKEDESMKSIQSLSSLPIDIISNVNSCAPKFSASNSCYVIDGAMTVVQEGKEDESVVVASIVNEALQASFTVGKFLVGDIVDINMFSAVSPVTKSNEASLGDDENDKSSILVWAFSIAVIGLFVFVSVAVTFRIMKNEKLKLFSSELDSVKVNSIGTDYNDDESTFYNVKNTCCQMPSKNESLEYDEYNVDVRRCQSSTCPQCHSEVKRQIQFIPILDDE